MRFSKETKNGVHIFKLMEIKLDTSNHTYDFISFGAQDFFIEKIDAIGNLLWAKQFGGIEGDISNAIIADYEGNVYVTGFFSGIVDFDPGIDIFNLTSFTGSNIFVLKLDNNGNFIWAKQMEGMGYNGAAAISIDKMNNVILTGYFEDTVDFDPGVGNFNLISKGGYDAFVLKLSSNGDFIWVKQMGGIYNDMGTSITTDLYSNIYSSGLFNGIAVFNLGADSIYFTTNGESDIFINKFDLNGNCLWVKQIGGVSDDCSNAITTDINNNVFITGYFYDEVDFDPNSNIFDLISNGNKDAFILKLDENGNFLWAKNIGGLGEDDGYSVNTNVSGYAYLFGNFNLTIDSDSTNITSNLTSYGGADIFLKLFDSFGNCICTEQFGGVSNDICFESTIDVDGNVIFTGFFQGSADFDPSSSNFVLSPLGYQDVFIVKLKLTSVDIRNDKLSNNICFTVIPNPSNGQFKIELYSMYSKNKIEIYDISGKPVYKNEMIRNNIEIELKRKPGLYFITVSTDESKTTSVFIIE